MDGIILPGHIEQAFALGYHCGRCRRTNPVVTMFYPTIRREDDHVVLTYPVRCTCGAAGGCTVRMPTLLFGYALAWVQIVKAWKRRSKAESQVTPGRSPSFDKIVREYTDLIARVQQARPQPAGSQDRLSLGMGEGEWTEFLKRIGEEPEEPGGE